MRFKLLQRMLPYLHLRTAMLVCAGLIIGFMTTVAQADVPPSERDALDQLWNTSNGSAWTDSTHWFDPLKTINVCTRFGIGCSTVQGVEHVTEIYLVANNLRGTLPPTLFQNLPFLQSISISAGKISNQLTGTIPKLTGLAYLEVVDLSFNGFTGSVPALQGLTNLYHFDVSSNQLTGTIPDLIGLTNLLNFRISNNQLTGSIPAFLGLTNLQRFDASANQLIGSIPDLSELTNLLVFAVSHNQLTGFIPDFIRVTKLGGFYASHNQLTGTIPNLSGLRNLSYIDVAFNQLSGSAPTPPNHHLFSGSKLCPNRLDVSNTTYDTVWDAATAAIAPKHWWYSCDHIFIHGFDGP